MKIVGLYSEAKMVDVGAAFSTGFGRRYKVDHAGAGAKLNQANLRNAPFLAEAKHPRVKVEHSVLIAASQDNMIDIGHRQRNLHVHSSMT
jgi:hypothetical protein